MRKFGEIPAATLKALSGGEGTQLAFLHEPAQIRLALEKSGMFDADFYRARYPDITAAGADPLDHYVMYGASEGRLPNLWFDTAFYVTDNPDIAGSITNPLLHFVFVGYREGRRPNPETKKSKRRLVLVILAGSSDLRDASRMARNAASSDVPPDLVLVYLKTPLGSDSLDYNSMLDLLDMGVQIKPYPDQEFGAPLVDSLTDYPEDAILFVNPLASIPGDWLEKLRTAFAADPQAIHAFHTSPILLKDGWIDLGMASDEGKSLELPVIGGGVLVPPGKCRSLAANLQYYKRFAPKFPDIWLGIEGILDGSRVRRVAVTKNLKQQKALSRFDDPDFMGQLKDCMCCFRRPLGKMLKISIPEQLYRQDLSSLYKRRLKYDLDWQRMSRFTEKLQYLKIFEDLALKSVASDKYMARKYFRQCVGEEYITPLLGVWKSFEEIDFARLPDSFVLKTNHGSAQNIIVRDKSGLDIEDARDKFNTWLKMIYSHYSFEISYFDIEPLIICEPFLGENLPDYKVLCFGGKPELIWLDVDRFGSHKRAFVSPDWQLQNIQFNYPLADELPPRPARLAEMLAAAAKIATPFRHARIDFYVLPDDSLRIGEVTFYSEGGLVNFNPPTINHYLGSLINLPASSQGTAGS